MDRCMHARLYTCTHSGERQGREHFNHSILVVPSRRLPSGGGTLWTWPEMLAVQNLKKESVFLFSKRQTDRETARMVTARWRNNKGASLPSPSLTTVKPNVSCQKNNENNAVYFVQQFIFSFVNDDFQHNSVGFKQQNNMCVLTVKWRKDREQTIQKSTSNKR